MRLLCVCLGYFFTSYSVALFVNKMQYCFHVQHVIPEPFEPSPFMPGGKAFDDEFNLTSGRQQRVLPDPDASVPVAQSDKESTKETNVAKIKVVVCVSFRS